MASDQDRDEAPEDTPTPARKTAEETARERERDRRARYARGIARSVFGRHYWDDASEDRMRAERRRRPPGGKVQKPKPRNGR